MYLTRLDFSCTPITIIPDCGVKTWKTAAGSVTHWNVTCRKGTSWFEFFWRYLFLIFNENWRFKRFVHHWTDLSLTQRLCQDSASASPGRFQNPHLLESGFHQPLRRCHPWDPAAYDHNPTVCLRHAHQSSHSGTLKLVQSGHWPICFHGHTQTVMSL